MIKIKYSDINLYDTLFSGQCFRMSEEDDGSYTVILSDRVINIREDNGYLLVDSNNLENLEEVVRYYFDLERDYESINSILSKNKIFRSNINKCKGYKILKQDKFEMFITYIISQNNNVKRITGIVNKLSERYGEKVIFRDKEYFLFPKYESIKDISVNELRSLGLGFRDSYVRSALDVLNSDSMYLEKLDFMDTESAIKSLCSIKGIGLKVASCILLFGYGRFDTFPIDTWVKQFVSNNFSIKSDINAIKKYMKEEFHEYSGIAIQYFFHIERNKNS